MRLNVTALWDVTFHGHTEKVPSVKNVCFCPTWLNTNPEFLSGINQIHPYFYLSSATHL